MNLKVHLKIILLLLVSSNALAAQIASSVFVDAGGESGQAFLVKHADGCHALLPTHVVQDNPFVAFIGRGANKPMAEGNQLMSFGYDLSVMQLEGELSESCGPLFDSVSRDVESLLNKDLQAQINMVNPDGSVSRLALTIVDQNLTHVFVKPAFASDHLMKGMSGSLISVSGKSLGLLLAVDAETAVGKVIRMDRALETVTPYFRSGSASPSQKPGVVASGENLAEKVTKWSAPAIDENHRANNIISSDKKSQPWRAKVEGFPVQLVIDLKGDEAVEIAAITLSGAGLSNDKSLARQIEILVDRNGNNRWKSLGSVSMSADGRAVSKAINPRLAKKIMLNIYSNMGGSKQLALSKIMITGP